MKETTNQYVSDLSRNDRGGCWRGDNGRIDRPRRPQVLQAKPFHQKQRRTK
jgi:hypothetical protein